MFLNKPILQRIHVSRQAYRFSNQVCYICLCSNSARW